jgi:alcohol dehydrogenase (cytochrome c)/quinohemoprotein ethanol dehydrogenase
MGSRHAAFAATFVLLSVTLIVSACQRQETPEIPATEPESRAVTSGPAWVDAARIANADAEPQNWLAHGRTWSEQRFSPLESINQSNVGELGLAWYFDLDTSRGQQASPIVVDGVIYTTSAWSKVQALDAATGQFKWQYDPEVPKEWDVKSCCGVQNRGAAVWKGRVYVGTIDGRLIALDAETGELQWEVQTTDRNERYSITGAPRVFNDKVVIGNGGAEYGVRGYVTAYDTETGEQAWRFYTVPGNPADGFDSEVMEMAASTWTGEWWHLGGGGTAWDSFAYDDELDLLYIGTGNGAPWTRTKRSPGGGDNLFLASIVAVRGETGEYVWHYQTVPGDTWDYTAVQHMILAEFEIDGYERKVIMQAPKNGFFYVLDRENGELLSAENIMPVNWATHVDIETGKPVIAEGARYDETGTARKITPGVGGAHNWHPMSFSPDTGLVYIPAQQEPFVYKVDEEFETQAIGMNLGVNYWDPVEEINELPPEWGPEFQGQLLAWDPLKQEEVWRVTQTTFENGGVLSTAGSLVFQGNSDQELVAYDDATGARLWSAPTQTGILAPPITYSVNGEQYVTVVAGWGGIDALFLGLLVNPDGTKRNISRVLAFKLGGNAELPPLPEMQAASPPPDDFGSEAQIQAGAAHYTRICSVCHGVAAISGGVLPDLRHSAYAADAAAWRSVVIEGALSNLGMISFAPIFSEEDAEAIRAFVVHQANATAQ